MPLRRGWFKSRSRLLQGYSLISNKTIGRLSHYRYLLGLLREDGQTHIHSADLAHLACVTPSQVRRDLMKLSASGVPARGYLISELYASIGELLDRPDGQKAALVGVGNLGRALLSFFSMRKTNIRIACAFSTSPEKIGQEICGVPCYDEQDITEVAEREGISVAILTLPAVAAQSVAQSLVSAGVRAILNFAPVRLHLGDDIYVENIDITMSLEKVAYFARSGGLHA